MNFYHAIIFALIGITLTSCQESAKWQFLETDDGSMPTARHSCGFLKHEGRLYLIGGRGLDSIDIYHPTLNVWTKGSPPPFEIHHFQPVSFWNQIIVLGAFKGKFPDEVPVQEILVYNPSIDRWSVLDTIPSSRLRASGGCVVYNDHIYWVGGIKNGHYDGHVEYLDRYDPRNKVWEILPPAPRARDHFQATELDGNIILGGGRRSAAPFGTFSLVIEEVDYYDIKEKQWATLQDPLPIPRGSAFSIISDRHYVIGGGEREDADFSLTELSALDWDQKKWFSLPDMNAGRHSTGIVLYDNHLITSCGNLKKGASSELNSSEWLDLKKVGFFSK